MPSEQRPAGVDDSLDALWARAQASERAGAVLAARDGYAEILAKLLDRGAPAPFHLIDRLAGACLTLGERRPAARLLLGARERMRSLGDDFGVYHVTLKLARVWLAAADIEGAEVFLREARLDPARTPSGAPASLGRVAEIAWPGRAARDVAFSRADGCLTLARYWAAIGRFQAAIRATSAALAVAPDAAPLFSASTIAQSLAELHMDCGDLGDASELERRFRAARGGAADRSPDETRWMLLAARRERMAGRLSHARRTLEALLGGDKGSPLRDVELQAAWALCDILARLNRINEAEKLLSRLDARMGDDPASRAWRGDFERLCRLLERKRASAIHETALPFVPQQVGDFPCGFEDGRAGAEVPLAASADAPGGGRLKERFADEWSLRFNEVLLELDAGRYDAARAKARSLERVVGATDSTRIAARTRYLTGLTAYHSGEHGAAWEAMSECLASAREQGLKLDELEALGPSTWAAAHLGRRDEYEHLSKEQKELLDELLASLDTEDRVHRRRNLLSRQDQYLSVRIASIASLPRRRIPVPAISEWLHRRRTRNAVLQRCREMTCLVGWSLDRSLKADRGDSDGSHRLPAPDEATTGDQVEAWVDTQLALARRRASTRAMNLLDARWPLRRIPHHSAILHYYAVADRLFAFVLTRDSAIVHTLPVTRIALDEGVQETLDAIIDQHVRLSDDRRVKRALRGLSTQLGLDAVLGRLSPAIDRLVIVPHDVLVHAPFAALRLGESALCERFAIGLLPNLRVFDPSIMARWRAPRSFLGVAVDDYPGTGLQPLRHAVAEVRRAASLYPDAKRVLLDGASATPGEVLGALGGVEWAHFACHGIFDVEAPHRSRLLVGSVNGKAGEVTLADLQRCDLTSVRLAVLAACWTSSSAVLPGGELVSLPAAFLNAGAHGVLATLWTVDDMMSGPFMDEFYSISSRLPPPLALAEVQRSRVRRGEMAYYWAGYVHHGNV